MQQKQGNSSVKTLENSRSRTVFGVDWTDRAFSNAYKTARTQ